MRDKLFDYPRLKDFPKNNAYSMLYRAVKDIDLKQIKHDLNVWCEIAINSETKSYHTKEEKDVIRKWSPDFSALIDAVYCIHKALIAEEDDAKFSDAIHEYFENYYKPDEKPIMPFEFCSLYFSWINIVSTRVLLWVLFEAVVIYRGELEEKLIRSDIVITYERFLVIAESAREIPHIRDQMKKRFPKSKKMKRKK